ncbi:type II secretion system protein [Planctomicrobium sp. SH527]|uniref:type II secretion system protein n=1 Tax=Planctomicrobium sp. SH527 TaxID=3448123 RepID=UPI003F5B4A88
MLNAKRQSVRTTFASRSAFTLVEILVVIGLVALLATILMMAMAPALEGARISATKATITQLNRMLQDQVDGLLNSNEVDKEADRLAKMFRATNGSVMPPAVAKTLAQMKLYRNRFPQRKEDLFGLDGVNRIETDNDQYKDDSDILKEMRTTGGGSWKADSWIQRNASPKLAANSDKAESSELLYVILSRGSVNSGSTALNVDQINPKHVGDTDGDGNLEFLDAWGNPLQFFNWPTGLFADPVASKTLVTANTAAIANADPFDPTNALSLWTPAGTGFNLMPGYPVPALNDPSRFKTPNRYWSFVILSAGPDDLTGFEPLPSETASQKVARLLGTPTNQDHILDNITNRQ